MSRLSSTRRISHGASRYRFVSSAPQLRLAGHPTLRVGDLAGRGRPGSVGAVAKSSNPRAQREREAERQRTQNEARLLANQKAARRQRMIGIGVLGAVVLATVGAVSVAAGSKNKATPTSAAPTTLESNSSTTVNTAVPVSLPASEAGASMPDATTCPPAEGNAVRTTHFAAAPPMCIDVKKDYTAKVHTTKGDLIVSLLPGSAPNSVNNFVVLARYHYYDSLPITRIMSRGWAEVADPKFPDGTTGPGYSIPSEANPQGSIATPLIFGTLPDASGNSGGGFLFGLADQAAGMPKNSTQIGNILDSRIDPNKPPEDQSTVQHLIDLAATTSGAPAEVIKIVNIEIIETAPK